MKKQYIFIGIAIILMIVVCFCFFISLYTAHKNVIEESHNYQPQSLISSDKKYVLQTHEIEDATGVFATFSVELQENQEIIFYCSDKYRAVDLKSISWSGTTLDIVVVSGDVGSITYQFVNETWEKQ